MGVEINQGDTAIKEPCTHQKVIATVDYEGASSEVWAKCLDCGLEEEGGSFSLLRAKPSLLLSNRDYWGERNDEHYRKYGTFEMIKGLS